MTPLVSDSVGRLWARFIHGGGEGSTALTVAIIVAAVVVPIAVGLTWRAWDRRQRR